MQRRDDRHPHRVQRREQVVAGLSAKDSKFVLDAQNIRVAEVEKVGGAAVSQQVLFGYFKPDFGRIVVALRPVVYCNDRTLERGILGRNSTVKVGGKGGDPALARHVIAKKGHFPQLHR
jgi:hypothetical protein